MDLTSFISASLGIWVFIPMAFWMLMIFDCARYEPDRQTWLWILLFINVPGAVIYFIARHLPRSAALPATILVKMH